jgi:hypothetical protein
MSWRYTNSIDDWLSDGTTATIWCHNAKDGDRRAQVCSSAKAASSAPTLPGRFHAPSPLSDPQGRYHQLDISVMALAPFATGPLLIEKEPEQNDDRYWDAEHPEQYAA